ncbi:MAG: hypothetical protein KDA17_05485 [Candidatus Saccharibacteria bacterium]|nr:hypothetical protein [Candidatus Saccharibacteria bacterium]
MAIMDSYTLFGEDFDLDQEAGNYLFTNQIDLGLAGRDIGNGQVLYLNMTVTEAFTDGGDSATLNLQLRSDDSASIHATTSSLHFETGAMLKAVLTLGAQFSFPIPLNNVVPYERYLGLQAVVATAGFDAGMITAGIADIPIGGWKAYPEGAN